MPLDLTLSKGAVSGGAIDFTMVRAASNVLPEGVTYRVDQSTLSGFGITAPSTPGSDWDQRYRDLLFVWEFGDAGTWLAPLRLLSGWNNRNIAYGPEVTNVRLSGGDVTLTVYRFSTNQSSTVTKTVSNTARDTAITGTNVIAINPTGDSDFTHVTGTHASAQTFNEDTILTSGSAWTAARAASGMVLIALKPGASYTMEMNDLSGSDDDGFYITTFGAGAKAILNAPRTGGSFDIMLGEYAGSGFARSGKVDVRLVNLDIRGDYNAQTNSYDNSAPLGQAFWASNAASVNLTMHGCDFEGLVQTVYAQETASTGAALHGYNFYIDDCTNTNHFGQYTVLVNENDHASSSFGITGNRFSQDVDAVSDSNMRAIFRIQSIATIHARGNDCFHTDDSQPCFKVFETPRSDGMVATIQHNVFEGGLEIVSFGRNFSQSFGDGSGGFSTARTAEVNAILENNILIGNQRTRYFVFSYVAGLTVRGNLLYLPDQTYRLNQCSAFIRLENWTSNSAPSTGVAISLYSNHYVNVRDHADNFSTVPVTLSQNTGTGYTAFSNVTEENNVTHQPNASPAQTVANLDGSTVLTTMRQKGYKDPSSPFSVTANTVPSDTNVYSFKPLTGATTVIGQASSGLTSPRVLDNDERASMTGLTGVLPTGGRSTPSDGAYEPALAS